MIGADGTEIQPDVRVWHDEFGFGWVLAELEWLPDRTKVAVRFEGDETQKRLCSPAALKVKSASTPNENDAAGNGSPPAESPNPLGRTLKRSELGSLPAVESLVDKVMSTPAVVVLVGSYGVGKTFLALSFACSIGTGQRWLGRDVKRTRALYVLGEGAYGIDVRVTAWEQAWHQGQPVSDDDLTFVVQPDSLVKPHTWAALGNMCLNGGYGFVALDTFSSLAADADETKDAALIMRYAGNLATKINGTVLLVHHPGWSDAGRTRGGSQFESNADEVLVAAEVSRGSEMFTLTRKKVKDGPGGRMLYLRRKASHDSCIIERTRAELAGIPLAERIIVVLGNYGDIGATGPQIRAELEIPDTSKSGFHKALSKLVAEGKVTEKGNGNARRYFLARQEGES